MRMTRWARGAVAAGLLAGTALAADVWKPVLSDAEFTTLVSGDAKTLKDALAKGADKKSKTKAKASAVMIAGYAQDHMLKGGANAAQLAGLRDHALKVVQAIADDKLDEAKKLAADLAPTSKGAGDGKTTPVALEKHATLDDVMSIFKKEVAGGREIEAKLLKITSSKQPLKPEQLKEAVPLLLMTAVAGQFTEAMAPEKDEGAKKKADWIKWSQEMATQSEAAAKAASAAKPDDKTVKAALKKLEASCAQCHSAFRDS